MSYTANVYNIFLASPGDVAQERKAAREIIQEWNKVNSYAKKIVLLALGWEEDAVPAMGDGPQGVINEQLLKRADLLVGIFWMRIGTPTGKVPSGTVQEIEEHIAANKQAMLYFSDRPIIASKIDTDQYEAVKKLRGFLNLVG